MCYCERLVSDLEDIYFFGWCLSVFTGCYVLPSVNSCLCGMFNQYLFPKSLLRFEIGFFTRNVLESNTQNEKERGRAPTIVEWTSFQITEEKKISSSAGEITILFLNLGDNDLIPNVVLSLVNFSSKWICKRFNFQYPIQVDHRIKPPPPLLKG